MLLKYFYTSVQVFCWYNNWSSVWLMFICFKMFISIVNGWLLISYDRVPLKGWKGTGRGVNFTPLPFSPCGFSKIVSFRERVKPCSFCLIILLSVTSFLKNSLKLLKSFRGSEDFLRQYWLFLSIFWIFLHFLIKNKLMAWAFNTWCQHFFTLNPL